MDTTDASVKPDTSDDAKLLEVAHKRFKAAKAFWDPIFDKYRDDVRFEAGEQWDPALKARREKKKLSCLTINKISSKVKYIVNNARSAMPSGKVHPVSEGASENTARIFDGLVRSIDVRSSGKQARIHAFKQTVVGGLGAWRVLVYECEPGRRDAKVERVMDPTTVLLDPAAKNMDFSDAEWGFLVSWMPREEFEEQNPDVDADNYAPEYKAWFGKDAVQVVEYWVRGEDGLFDQFLIMADKVLARVEDYPGEYLPIMFLTGEETVVEESRTFSGVVRTVRDMQILHNLTQSRMADWIARSAQPQWMGTVEQLGDFVEQWRQSNETGDPVLMYNETSSGTRPQRLDPLPPPTGLLETGARTDEDIRMTIGIRDPLADIPASQSGKAIQLQVAQGNIGTFEFADRLNELVKYEWKVLVDLIPKIFDYPHIREVMGLDGKVSTVGLNTPYIDNGEEVMHDLTRGKYLVTVSTGPSYESQRTEAADKLVDLVGKFPQIMGVAGDLIVRNLDFQGADELADRLQALIPPQALAASNPTNGDNGQAQAALLQQQIEQMGQQLQQAQQQGQEQAQALQQAQGQLATKSQEIQLKAQAEEQAIQSKAQVDLLLAREKASHEMEMERMRQDHEYRMKMLDLSGKANLQDLAGGQKLDQIAAQGQVSGELSGQAHAQGMDAQVEGQEHEKDIMELDALLNIDAFDKTGEDLDIHD